MAYGDGRSAVASDPFDSSINGTNWENGGGDWGAMQWVTGGHVEPASSGVDCTLRRQVGTYANDQYSKLTVQNTTDEGWIQPMVRMAAGTNESAYMGGAAHQASHSWQIWETDSGLGYTQLANQSSSDGELVAGETITTEVEGTTIRVGSDASGSDVQKTSATDATISSGMPGVGAYWAGGGEARITAWEGGSIGASATQNLAPSLYSDSDTFFAPTVGRGAVGLAPSLYNDSDTFFAPTVASTYGLAPALYSDADTFFSPTVAPGAVNLAPALFTDSDTFFTPTVSGAAPAQDLTPSLFTDGDTFFAPTVTRGAVDLAPALYSDADAFFSPTVAPGAVDLTPDLFTDGDTFFSATVAAAGQLVQSEMFSDPDVFFSPTVAAESPFIYVTALDLEQAKVLHLLINRNQLGI